MRLLLTLLLTLSLADARPWTDDVMYFVLTDRFHDGDPANNVPAGSDPGLHDPAQKDIRRCRCQAFPARQAFPASIAARRRLC